MANLIKKCVLLSELAYNKENTIACDNEAFLIKKEGNIIFIAFAGSNDLKDWVEDSDIKTSFLQKLGVEIHHGFWTSMMQCWFRISFELMSQYTPGNKIIITGHSKGAAMAFCLRLKLIIKDYPMSDIFVYGYGSPRVVKTNSKNRYNRLYNINVNLFVNQGDPVTKLPREYMGYSTICNNLKVVKVPWYKRIYIIRSLNHKIKTYTENFG
tara:strand:+ start:311 stop:943 length:633 start_codon:yes stop_codon:yes gene_type:complete